MSFTRRARVHPAGWNVPIVLERPVNHRQRTKLCCLMRHQGITDGRWVHPDRRCPRPGKVVCVTVQGAMIHPRSDTDLAACVGGRAANRKSQTANHIQCKRTRRQRCPDGKRLTSSRGLAGKIAIAPDLLVESRVPSSELAARLEARSGSRCASPAMGTWVLLLAACIDSYAQFFFFSAAGLQEYIALWTQQYPASGRRSDSGHGQRSCKTGSRNPTAKAMYSTAKCAAAHLRRQRDSATRTAASKRPSWVSAHPTRTGLRR